MCTEKSDQLALLRAYEGWASELNSGGMGAARRFAGKPDLFCMHEVYMHMCVYISIS